jgi:hypothetical protein
VAVVDQRHLNPLTSIAYVAAEVEDDWQESVRKLTQDHCVSTKLVHATLHKNLQL